MTCQHPDIANMDHTRGGWPGYPAEKHVNRCCTKCWQHWAGPVDNVTEYTQAEWDASLKAAWARDVQESREWNQSTKGATI